MYLFRNYLSVDLSALLDLTPLGSSLYKMLLDLIENVSMMSFFYYKLSFTTKKHFIKEEIGAIKIE